MFTMVMMVAATSGGDAASFGWNKGGCSGSCHGTTVVAAAPACVAPVAVAPVSSCTGCTGSSCHGKGGFLGLGLFNGHKSSCHGSTSCHGAAVVSGGCHGSVAPVTFAPVTTASCGGCGAALPAAAPVMGGMPVMGAPVMGGCFPTMGTVGGPVMTPPVVMPVAPPTDKPKEEPKKEEKPKDKKEE